MTSNQIKYQELEETRYHNRVMEQETKRTNEANERIKQETNAINQQHYMYSDAETARSNQARESETAQHNRTTEAIEWFKAGSQDKLNKSNIQLNTTIQDNYLQDTEKKKAETWLTQEKAITESDYYRPNLWSTTQKIYAEKALTEQKTQTEKWNTTKTYGEAGLTSLDIQWYGTKQKTNVLNSAMGNVNSLIGAATRLWGTIYSANQNYAAKTGGN